MPVQAKSGGLASMVVWIERADGTILRGGAEAVSSRSARVRLPGRHAFHPHEHVLLSVCFSPERPTVAASAEVRRARQLGEAVDCDLDWDLSTVEFGCGPAHPRRLDGQGPTVSVEPGPLERR
ncbi:MAG TPA: hypothetical protein VLL75_10400 [Vicinamibacteria bacterium]|nr:hypothetical protein [Vicinamibacteria bacterium]